MRAAGFTPAVGRHLSSPFSAFSSGGRLATRLSTIVISGLPGTAWPGVEMYHFGSVMSCLFLGSKAGKIFGHGETPFDVEVGTRLTGSLQKSVGDFVR